MFSTDHGVLDEHTRKLTFAQDEDFDKEELIKKSQKAGKPFKSIVEYVFNGCSLNLYVESLGVIARVNMNHVHTPAKEKAVSDKAKAMTEKLMLNQVVGVTF